MLIPLCIRTHSTSLKEFPQWSIYRTWLPQSGAVSSVVRHWGANQWVLSSISTTGLDTQWLMFDICFILCHISPHHCVGFDIYQGAMILAVIGYWFRISERWCTFAQFRRSDILTISRGYILYTITFGDSQKRSDPMGFWAIPWGPPL